MSFYGLYFPAAGLNKVIYSVNLRIQHVYSVNIRIQSEYGKKETRKTPNSDSLGSSFWSSIFTYVKIKFNQTLQNQSGSINLAC